MRKRGSGIFGMGSEFIGGGRPWRHAADDPVRPCDHVSNRGIAVPVMVNAEAWEV
jgi:hypothetical protein